MASSVLIGGKAWRVISRRSNSITVQPIGTEYPHRTLFRMPGDDRWSMTGGFRPTWYRKIADDCFELAG